MTRDELVAQVEELVPGLLDDESLVLFDGLEDAFVGVAQRFEPVTQVTVTAELVTDTLDVGGEHRWFLVYDWDRMVELLMAGGMDRDDVVEYLEFNTVGLYAGPNTPAILYQAGAELGRPWPMSGGSEQGPSAP